MSKKTKDNDSEIINFYDKKEVKKLMTQFNNPAFEDHKIKFPARIGMIGNSGAGKTSCLLNLIHKCPSTFGHIFVVYKASEPLYEYLAKKIGAENITFYTRLYDFPTIENLPHVDEAPVLVIFDDQINEPEKAQQICKEIAIRGRKWKKSISMVYLSQSFFRIPKTIRLQFTYVIVLKLSSLRDLNLMMTEYNTGLDKEEMHHIYKDATRERFSFLKIDVDGDPNVKFSKNFKHFYKIEDDSGDEDG